MPVLLCCSVWLLPVSLLAQPFDVENRRHAVVRILGDRGNNIGSGALIKVDGTTGYILTAHHIIQHDADHGKTSVQVEFYSGQVVEAHIFRHRLDESNDIAVLVIESLPTTSPIAIPFGSASAVQEMQQVHALGHRNEVNWAVTEGTVNRKQGGKLYFSGTAVHHGNSGGPLLDEHGVLVAMNRRLGEGLGIALTWDVIRPLIEGWVPELPGSTLPVTRRGKDKKDMLLIPEGWFQMGSIEGEVLTDENPLHQVWVDAFYMDKYEVTVGEYKAFVKATGRLRLPESVSQFAPTDIHPVVMVSWEDADAYCGWAGKQLPTEAQWEKAARGKDGRQYPWGNNDITVKRANYCDHLCEYGWKDKDDKQTDGYRYTAPVGSYPSGKSPYNIEDLAGNVWEWVQDWYDAKYYQHSPKHNPVNDTPGKSHVLRGGSWANHPADLRVVRRYEYVPEVRNHLLGFRCVVAAAASRP